MIAHVGSLAIFTVKTGTEAIDNTQRSFASILLHFEAPNFHTSSPPTLVPTEPSFVRTTSQTMFSIQPFKDTIEIEARDLGQSTGAVIHRKIDAKYPNR